MSPNLPNPGEIFAGRYQLVSVLGQGGHGRVYRARDCASGRAVALKLLATGRTDAITRERFRREAKIARHLRHDHVAEAHDAGESADGLPFIVYELLQGETLSELCRREGPQPWELVSLVSWQLLSALHHAHALGVVHRDIKPANVFLHRDESNAVRAKLLDFGISIVGRNAMRLTQPGEFVGTPRYMAPEQLTARTATPATDLFSLGLVLGEMLSGKPVFAGSAAVSLLARVSPEPTPLSESILDSPFARMIQRATEKSVSFRTSSASEMLADLRSGMRGHRGEPSGIHHIPRGSTTVDLDPTWVDSTQRSA